MGADQKSPTG